MKISTEIGSATKITGEEKAVEYIGKAGFDAWDFSMYNMCSFDFNTNKVITNPHPLNGNEYLKFARKLKQIGLDNGIVCNQSHAPFPSECLEIKSYLKRAIECTAETGGRICVIHPCETGSTGNLEMYLDLLDFAKDYNVKVATENMYSWSNEKNEAIASVCATPQSYIKLLNEVNDENFVACLDIGHAEMKGIGTNAAEMIRTLGSKLEALHIHDNNKWHDSHQIPFSMSIDYQEIVKALIEVNYSGYLTLEAKSYLNTYSEENILDGIKNLAISAKKLAEMFELTRREEE